LSLLLLLVACGSGKVESAPSASSSGQQELPTMELELQGTRVTVEIADSDHERAQGLMYRESLDADHGMLFVYPDEDLRYFWMKDTPLPLSIAFFDADGMIVNISDMRPLSEQTTPSKIAAQYALEMNQGWFRSHGVRTGQTVTGLPTTWED